MSQIFAQPSKRLKNPKLASANLIAFIVAACGGGGGGGNSAPTPVIPSNSSPHAGVDTTISLLEDVTAGALNLSAPTDSDGDTLPDGWEADGQCTWSPLRVGVNPMNGSDAFENPDGDGYDVNKNGVLEPSEMFVNYLEYHISTDLFLNNQTFSGIELPNGFETDLFDNISDYGLPEATFAERASGAILATQISLEKGSCDPFKADTDEDGMPDGWEIWFAR